jgi:hypothetical protein
MEFDFPRIFKTANAGAYLVNRSYYSTLLSNRKESLRKLTSFEMLYTRPDAYTADVYWNSLVRKDRWFGIYPCICKQVISYSDNSNCTYRADEVNGIFQGKGNLFDAI